MIWFLNTYCEILGKGNWISRKTVEDMNNKGEILKNLVNPPLKDNVAVPDAGFTVVRFVADNVGYWLFHCHMNWHNHLGEIISWFIYCTRAIIGRS